MVRNVSMRCWNPFGSCSQRRLCRNTRMVFMPIPSAQPSSRSIVVGSKVSACHISNSLLAVDGKKFAPTGHACFAYQSLTCCSVQRIDCPLPCCPSRAGIVTNKSSTLIEHSDARTVLRADRRTNSKLERLIDSSELRTTILLRFGEVCCLVSLGGSIFSASLPFIGDGELIVRLCKGGIGGDRLLIARDRIGDLSPQHELITGIQRKVCALATDRAACKHRSFATIIGGLVSERFYMAAQLVSLLCVPGRFCCI